MTPNEILTLSISGLAALIAGGTLYYEICLNHKQKKYIENQDELNLLYIKSFIPILHFNKINYSYIKNEENYQSYTLYKNNADKAKHTYDILVSIKNYSSGIAKNIIIEQSIDSNISVEIESSKILNINGNKEEYIIFNISDSLYKKDQLFQLMISYEDINGKVFQNPSYFKISAPRDGIISR